MINPSPSTDQTVYVRNTTPNRSSSLPLVLYYQNVRGLRTKLNDLHMTLSACDYDVVVFTETWLNDNIMDTELTNEYVIYRCDRSPATSQFRRGGGVLIGVKRHLQSNVYALVMPISWNKSLSE